MTRIALDAMGGDHALSEIIRGAVIAAEKYPDLEITLIGEQTIIENETLSEIANKRRTIQDAIKRASEVEKDPDKSAEIYRSIIKTYQGDRDVADLVKQAQAKLYNLGYSS